LHCGGFDEEDPVLTREFEKIVSSADEAGDVGMSEEHGVGSRAGASRRTTTDDFAATPATTSIDVQQFFAKLQIRPTNQGGISIEAPPEAAATLASVFEGMAKLLRAQAG
jgi:hypothetical protein